MDQEFFAAINGLADSPLQSEVLHPRQHDDDHIEDGQRDHREGRRQEVSIHLVDAERSKDDDRRGVRPELRAKERPYKQHFDDPVHQQVHSGEKLCVGRESLGQA